MCRRQEGVTKGPDVPQTGYTANVIHRVTVKNKAG